MKKRLLIISLILIPISVFADAQKEVIEQGMRVAHQQARCMDAILEKFPSKNEEQLAYSKFYKSLVKHHKQFIDYALKHEESGMPRILEYVESPDILVGMVMQGTMIRASEHNKQYDKERSGKSLGEFNKYVWDMNGCDAIYSSI